MSEISFSVGHRQNENIYTGKGNSNTTSVSLVKSHADIYKAVTTGQLEGDGVSLTISDEAREKLSEMYDKFMKMQEEANKVYAAKCDEEAGKSQAEAMEKQMEEQSKAMEIARRIAKGGIVPPQDEKKLMEFSSEMYQMAKNMAMMAKEHKKYKDSLYEDEEAPEEHTEEFENEKFDVIMDVPNEMIESGEVNIDIGNSFEE